MPNPVTVRKVEDRSDFKAFFEFPWTLYKDDPHWVPPLLSMRRDLLDKEKNPSWEYLEGDYFTAWRGDTIVGTIAAFVNKRHNEFHNEHIAWFGFFEVFNDPEAASALLNTAAQWAKSHGYHAIRGPQSFTNMEECGLLVDGFTRPILLMPYNPPYYQELVEDAGFHKVMDTYSFYGNWKLLEEAGVYTRFAKLTKRIQERGNITVRQIDRKNLKKDFELFKEIYNTAWEKNWGFTPFSSAELDALVEGLGMFFDPALACFAYVGDDPAGFLLGVPDFNQVLHRAYARPGTPEIFTLLKVLWYWKIRPSIDWMRIPLMGVKEQYRNQGVDFAMYNHILHVVRQTHYQHLDTGWILETNTPMINIQKSTGTEIHRTYRFYEKRFSPQATAQPEI